MVEGSGPHPRWQGNPHLWWTNNGKAKLGTRSPQKGKLLELLLVLHLRNHQPPSAISWCIRPAVELLLGHLLGLKCLRKFTLKESKLTDEALGILPNRSQNCDILHPPHAPVDSSVTQAYLHLPETNAAKIRMGRNEETQREPGMHMRVFLFSFKN
jgi:hypothetical protein